MQNKTATAPAKKNVSRSLLSRTPGILFATAALFLSFSGAAAPALDAAEVAPPPLPNIATEDAEPAPAPAAEAAIIDKGAPQEAADDTRATLSFTTGDQLTSAQQQEFLAYIAALKAQGKHRGPAIYTSW